MAPTAVLTSLGIQLRSARERRGLTLDELSRATGMSKAHLSRIESGERQPAIATLLTVAQALDVRVGALLGEDDGEQPLSIHPPDGVGHEVNGLTVTPCSGFRGSRELEALHLRIAPDRPVPDLASHPGEEWLHVLGGTLRLEYAGGIHVLATGTSAHFDALQPHRLGAEGAAVEVLLVATSAPRGFSDLHG